MVKSTKELARRLGILRKRSVQKSEQDIAIKKAKKSNQMFSYLIVIDFESTCWKDKKSTMQEIIEFPAVLLNTATGEIESEFHTFVQPWENPKLSDFCKELTGISQEQVDSGMPVHVCLGQFSRWLRKLSQEKNFTFHLGDDRKLCTFVTWSDWDLGVCLHYEARRKQLRKPSELNSWIDLRSTYRNFYERRPNGLNGALQDLGITFTGREHSGLDDARNTAKLAWRMICDGCVMKITKTLNSIPGAERSGQAPSRAQSGRSTAQFAFSIKKAITRHGQVAVTNQTPGNNAGKNTTTVPDVARGKDSVASGAAVVAVVVSQAEQRESVDGDEITSSYVDSGSVVCDGRVGGSCDPTPTVVVEPATGVPQRQVQTDGGAVRSIVSLTTTLSGGGGGGGGSFCGDNFTAVKKPGLSAPSPATVGSLRTPNVISSALTSQCRSALTENVTGDSSHKKKDETKSGETQNNQVLTATVTPVSDRNKSSPPTTTTESTGFKTPCVPVTHRTRQLSTITNKIHSTTSAKMLKTAMACKTPNAEYKTPVRSGAAANYLQPAQIFKTPIDRASDSKTPQPMKMFQTPTMPSRKTPPSGKITPPLCPCGRRSKKRTVMNPGPNQGRGFFSCPASRGCGNNRNGCGFFKWEVPCSSPRSVSRVSPTLKNNPGLASSTPVLPFTASRVNTPNSVVMPTGKRNLGVRAALSCSLMKK